MTKPRLIQNLSIKYKVVLVILSIIFLIHSIGFSFITHWDVNRIQSQLQTGLTLNAQLVAHNCVVPLTFGDDMQAMRALSHLESIEFIETAYLFDKSGQLFATYPDTLKKNAIVPFQDQPETGFIDDVFYVKESVYYNSKTYGTLFIKANSDPLKAAKKSLLLVLFFLSLLLDSLAVFLAIKMQRYISGPILRLSEHFNRLSKNQDFSVRLSKENNDEIGRLYDGFNNLLDQIVHRQQDLKESEERFRTISENAPILINSFDADGRCVFWNKQCHDTFGWTFDEVAEQDVPLKLFYPEPKMYAEVVRTITSDPDEVFRESTPTARDGKMLNVMWANFKLPNGQVFSLGLDVTQQKAAERSLRESESEFRKLFESTALPLCYVDNVGTLTIRNQRFIETFGYTATDVPTLKEWWIEAYPDEDYRKWVVANWEAAVDHAAVTGDDIRSDVYDVMCKDGSVRHVMISGSVFEEGFLATFIDITERRQAEQALFESEEKLNLVIKTSPVGICTVDNLGAILSTNPAYERMIGYSKEECKRLSFFDVTHPDDRPTNNNLFQSMFSLETKDFSMEKRYVCKDGSVINVDVHAVGVLDAEGKVRFGTAFVDDITERKLAEEALRESEEKLSTLFSSLTEMVVMHELVLSADGVAIDYRIVDCNEVFTKFTGIRKSDAVGRLGSEVYQMTPPPHLENFARVALGGDPYEYRAYHPALDKHLITSVVSPKLRQFATISTDISDMMQIQEIIVAKNKEMENYLYVASHDLRAPLVNIQGFSLRLKKHADAIKTLFADRVLEPVIQEQLDEITTEDFPKTLGFILGNIEKMDTLINGLLRLSRTGAVKMSIKEIDVEALLTEILGGLDFQLKEAQCEVHIETLPACYGDATLLDQLFANVISNALKYADSERALEIKISAKKTSKKVVYCIADTGIGIPKNRLDKIWDVFFRIDPRFGKAGEGIGLSLVKRIVDKHRGKVWAESEEGQGSRFYIELNRHSFTEL